MRRRESRLLHLFVLGGVLATVFPAQAAVLDPETDNNVTTEIREYGERHADSGGPLQTALILELFRNNEAGLPLMEVARIYEQAYSARKAAKKPGLWDEFRPTLSVLAAILLALFALFRAWIREIVGKGFQHLGSLLYGRFAGSRFLRRLALKQYRKGLINKFQLLKNPFWPGRPILMSEVYVPIKAVEARGDAPRECHHQEVDAYEALTRHLKIVVVGAPGSGKSMLLKHIAFAYAKGHLPAIAGAPIPVLVELHRLSDGKTTIEEQIVAELGRTGFPHAETFVARNLEESRLMVLLDGLDEVPTGERARVCQLVRDLLQKHSSIRLVLTCRSQVYRGDFDEVIDKRLELVDFSDAQIQRFLRVWGPSMPPEKSVDQLLKVLADRPQIKALAGNPLLLTLIAYLHSEGNMLLPHSRSQFHRYATDVLLKTSRVELSFTPPDKRSILRHLALFNLDGADPSDQDRRTIDFRVARREVASLCQSLNRKVEDALPIIDEIVERSGLLLRLDRGERYGFPHLTIQEFFAAERLLAEPKELMERFGKDPDRWREVMKLWCGLAEDCTEMILGVHEIDPLTAFECLAEAQKVSQEVSDLLVAEFKDRLGENGGAQEAIRRAFGVVAADPRASGEELFTFLISSLAEPRLREAAADALARTNLTRAAEVLIGHVETDGCDVHTVSYLHKALCVMGDIAVPALAKTANVGDLCALADLRSIATPRAAQELVGLLWHETPAVAIGSAAALGSLLLDPAIEASLREHTLTPQQRAAKERIDWIWKPFAEPEGSALPAIVGRIAYLVDVAPPAALSPDPLPMDPRLAIPLAVKMIAKEPGFLKHKDILDVVLQKFGTDGEQDKAFKSILLARGKTIFIDRRYEPEIVKVVLDHACASLKFQALIHAMPMGLQIDFVDRILLSARLPSDVDWVNVHRPLDYDLFEAWHLRATSLVAVVMSIPPLAHVFYLFESTRGFVTSVWFGGMALMLVASVVLGLFWAIQRSHYDKEGDISLVHIVSPALMFFQWKLLLDYIVDRQMGDFAFWIFPAVATSGWIFASVYYGGPALRDSVSEPVFLACWCVLFSFYVALTLIALRRDHLSQNPLRGILDP